MPMVLFILFYTFYFLFVYHRFLYQLYFLFCNSAFEQGHLDPWRNKNALIIIIIIIIILVMLRLVLPTPRSIAQSFPQFGRLPYRKM